MVTVWAGLRLISFIQLYSPFTTHMPTNAREASGARTRDARGERERRGDLLVPALSLVAVLRDDDRLVGIGALAETEGRGIER